MTTRCSRTAQEPSVERNIGTLWTLTRGESTARCSLLVTSAGLEVRVLMDGALLRGEPCDSHQQAFELAQRWQARMMDRGWTRVLPPVTGRNGSRVAAL